MFIYLFQIISRSFSDKIHRPVLYKKFQYNVTIMYKRMETF